MVTKFPINHNLSFSKNCLQWKSDPLCFHLHIDGFTTDLMKKGRHFGHKDPPEDPKSAFSTFSRTALEATVSTFYQ